LSNPAPIGEFELIRRCFCSGFPTSDQTRTGIGDDASVVMPPPQHTLVQSIDTQVADVHFPATAPAHLIAQRALRCAASDLAAMGATPQGFFLALTLPRTQHSASRNKPTSRQHNQQTGQQERLDWLEQFADGLRDAAHACQLSLLGGDTTSGNELVVSCLVQGWLPANNTGLLRSGAQPGDQVWVSGELGRGALALPQVLKNPAHSQGFAQHYYFPEPRLQAGQALLSMATSAMDISDGLLQDAGHIASASQVSIQLLGERIPTAVALGHPDWPACLTGGDDYELLFTAPAAVEARIQALSQALKLPLHCIGHCREAVLEAQSDTRSKAVELTLKGQPLMLERGGFQHF